MIHKRFRVQDEKNPNYELKYNVGAHVKERSSRAVLIDDAFGVEIREDGDKLAHIEFELLLIDATATTKAHATIVEVLEEGHAWRILGHVVELRVVVEDELGARN